MNKKVPQDKMYKFAIFGTNSFQYLSQGKNKSGNSHNSDLKKYVEARTQNIASKLDEEK